MHSNVQYFPDPPEPFTKPLVFHIVRGQPHMSSFANPWLEIIPPSSPWFVVRVLQSHILCLWVALWKAVAGSEELTPGISSIPFPGTLFPTLSPPRFVREMQQWTVICELADTDASPGICTCDLPCPEEELSKRRALAEMNNSSRLEATHVLQVKDFCRTVAPKPLKMLQLFV